MFEKSVSETVSFGALGVCRIGLTRDNEKLVWADVKKVSIDELTVTVVKRWHWMP